MNKKTRWILVSATLGVALLAMWSFTPGTSGHRNGEAGKKIIYTPSFKSYDLRENPDKIPEVFGAYRARLSANQRSRVAAAAEARQRGEAKLAARVPDLTIERGHFGFPEAVGVKFAKQFLTAPSEREHDAIVREFVEANAAVYGLTAGQVRQLNTIADYANPAGNLSWIEFEQRINDIPVFSGTLRACLTSDGAVARTTGLLAPGLDYQSLAKTPVLSPAEGAVAAARSINYQIDPTSLSAESSDDNGRTQILSRGPFVEDIKTQLVYFPLESGVATLAYSMVLWEDVNAYYILVDAETGLLLWRKNITSEQTQTVTYNIYNDDSPAPLSPTTAQPGSGLQGAAIARTDVTVINEMPPAQPFSSDPWLVDGAGNVTTTGNNVDAGLDIDGVNGIDAGTRAVGTGRVLSFIYNPAPGIPAPGDAPTGAAYRNGIVTNIFFWTNRYHDRVYNLGFNELARNFQTNNYGRGGLGNDFVRAEAQDSVGTNNANFSTPADGSLPRMQMFIFTGPTPDRDGDTDAEIFIHEMTHGLSNRLHNNAAGLTTAQGGGMGEGWGDFFGRSILATAGENVNGLYASGAYATLQLGTLGTDNGYYGIRRFPYAVKTNIGANGKPHYPLTFADIDPAQVNTTDGAFPESPLNFTVNNGAAEVHNIGEIWCMMLLEVRARMITRLGFAVGNQRALQIVTDAMKLDVSSPTLVQARDTIIAADNAGFAGNDVNDIWAGFATRGNGFGSSTSGTATVVESFLTPNLQIATPPGITFSDAGPGANHNTYADPGETVVLTVPLTNPLASTAIGATATIAGNSANYGDIAPGATVTRTIPYTIPAATPCGASLVIPVDVNSSLGPVTPSQTFTLNTGALVLGFSQNFDGVVVPALPAGWTTAHTGALADWVTSATTPSSAPNDAFSNEVTTVASSELVTPSIPITTGSAQLSFRNLFNLEFSSVTPSTAFDGLVLEIAIPSVAGGAFQDIVTAGGSFVSNGYNKTMSSGFSNPLAGRPVWSGLSAGTTAAPAYITSVVNLPAAANGQSIRLKWRRGDDSSAVATGVAGVRIDTITIATGSDCLAPTAAPASISGKVTTPDGAPLAGVTMNLSGGTTAKVITDSQGNYRFNNIDTDNFYSVTPSLVNYHFGPESRSFSLLANMTDATFAATRDAVVSGNAIDTPEYFVRQHYLDFLGREPDQSGFNFWSDQIRSCGTDAGCIERRTINVSAAYFLSIEFQETGALVDRLYRASYNRRPLYAEFMPDQAVVAHDVVVGSANWAQTLEANKQAFIDAWVQRPEFQSAYGGLGNEAYVDMLVSHTGGSFNGNREALVNGLNSSSLTRAAVLRQVVENGGFTQAKRNEAFVMMQYFGYLRRDPDASGYQFWLNKLNQFDGNFEQAEMVKAFLVSGEYRDRFRL